MSHLIYLASPYSHRNLIIRRQRFHQAIEAAAHLIRDGKFVFSPIVHSHPIADEAGLPLDWEYWQKLDELMLSCCDSVIVLTIDGWKESQGIAAELKLARALSMPISYLSYERGDWGIAGSAP